MAKHMAYTHIYEAHLYIVTALESKAYSANQQYDPAVLAVVAHRISAHTRRRYLSSEAKNASNVIMVTSSAIACSAII